VEPVVRTILGIDNENQSMILAGDVPKGSTVQLMMARWHGGALKAAEIAMARRQTVPVL
jgi:hypothetical protein